jgi:hypothetical protein
VGKKSKQAEADQMPEYPQLPPTDAKDRAAKLLSICVDLLELCTEVTGTIDPAAAWLIAHVRDEVTLGTYGVRYNRPY